DMLLVAMEYWYEKRTYEQIAASYKLAASNVCRSIKWIEEVLARDGTFQVSLQLNKNTGKIVEPTLNYLEDTLQV
ncbi:MAG: transposase family protein, partial [Oscillospiraceae bacterium]|nr:transposase family protein [Oscillospiraceae bacterium]